MGRSCPEPVVVLYTITVQVLSLGVPALVVVPGFPGLIRSDTFDHSQPPVGSRPTATVSTQFVFLGSSCAAVPRVIVLRATSVATATSRWVIMTRCRLRVVEGANSRASRWLDGHRAMSRSIWRTNGVR